MGFLDNLESSLKSLETREERSAGEAQRRDQERRQKTVVGPWADRLKESDYTKALFEKAAMRGHLLRTKIYLAWVDTALRLEARGRVMQLQPTADGVVAEYEDLEGRARVEPIDLAGDPDDLLERWVGSERPIYKEQSDGE